MSTIRKPKDFPSRVISSNINGFVLKGHTSPRIRRTPFEATSFFVGEKIRIGSDGLPGVVISFSPVESNNNRTEFNA